MGLLDTYKRERERERSASGGATEQVEVGRHVTQGHVRPSESRSDKKGREGLGGELGVLGGGATEPVGCAAVAAQGQGSGCPS